MTNVNGADQDLSLVTAYSYLKKRKNKRSDAALPAGTAVGDEELGGKDSAASGMPGLGDDSAHPAKHRT